jgi:hypothetical protein
MNRSDFLIAYACTACKHRWLVDTEPRASVSFDDLHGDHSRGVKLGRIGRAIDPSDTSESR